MKGVHMPSKNSDSYLRRSMRIPVSHNGEVNDGKCACPCLIQDMSRRGFRIVFSQPFRIGQVLNVVSRLSAQITLECTVKIQNAEEDFFGFDILEVSPQTAADYWRFVLGFYPDKPPAVE